jgi:hypothetical protein
VTQKARFLPLLGCFVFALIQIASADIIQDLTVDITCYPCSYHSGFFTQVPHWVPIPAIGSADYTFLGLPWSFSYQTGIPTSWVVTAPTQFTLQFGQGGNFTMTGPHGLTFAGIVESGYSVNFYTALEEISLNFSGQWSNGATAVGSIFQSYNGWTSPQGQPGHQIPVGNWSELHTHPTSGPTTPEPGSLILLGSALLGAWRYRMRHLQ